MAKIATVLQNGKLLKYQTIESGKVVDYAKVKSNREFGVLQSTAGEITNEDWASLATFNGISEEEQKQLLKKH